jgi:hypothetical protein
MSSLDRPGLPNNTFRITLNASYYYMPDLLTFRYYIDPDTMYTGTIEQFYPVEDRGINTVVRFDLIADDLSSHERRAVSCEVPRILLERGLLEVGKEVSGHGPYVFIQIFDVPNNSFKRVGEPWVWTLLQSE